MKKLLTLATLSLAAILSCGATALAQNSNDVVAEVPFKFTVGEAQFDAGKYFVHNEGNTLMIHSADGSKNAIVHTQYEYSGKPASRTTLEFLNEAGDMKLAGVRTIGSRDTVSILGVSGSSHHVSDLSVSMGK